MFDAKIYQRRRDRLVEKMSGGVVLLMGNNESPMNYADNCYPFRQDSSFLYFIGIDKPGLAAIIDLDENKTIVFGDDFTVAQIVWMGPQPTIAEMAAASGVSKTQKRAALNDYLQSAAKQNREVHFLPPYRADNLIEIADALNQKPNEVKNSVSKELIRAVIDLRLIKGAEEIKEIEKALAVSKEMHVEAMKMTRPGIYERDVVAKMEAVAYSHRCRPGYPPIFSINGQTLHNHDHDNLMKDGDMVVNDTGADSPMHYASDITRTIPVGGKFDERQRTLYELILEIEKTSIRTSKPGVKFRDVHIAAGRMLLEGLKDFDLVRGDMAEAAEIGVQGLFFQCGLGHMMGLDTHDMEDLGEELVGYDSETTRSEQFGLCYLRLARALEPGFLITVEPGVYFIPELIDQWRAENKFADFVNYDKVEGFRGFGGIRIEDNVLITKTGQQILGEPIPKSVSEVEALTGSGA